MDPHYMTPTQEAAYEEDAPFGAYMAVFAALCVFTAVSFIVNAIFGAGNLTGAAIIMGVAVVKATLVAMYFMHLAFDWKKLYFIIIPLMILTVMMVIVLLPDI